MFFIHFPSPLLTVKNPIKKTEYFFLIEIFCNIDDYCVSLIYFCGWYIFNTTGIDLNLQFPAKWEKAKQIKFSQGITSPAPRDFVGDFPLQAPEALAIYNFTNANNFDLVIAYHTQGKEIYWQFENYAPKGSFEIAKKFENVSGYSLADVPYASSFAGFKDFFIQKYQRPGFTIEAGLGENPLSLSQFNQIYKDNIGILVLGGALI